MPRVAVTRGKPPITPTVMESPRAKLRVDWLNTLDAIDRLGGDWKALESRVEHRTVYVTHDYLAPWYRAYAGTKYTAFGEPLVGAVWDGSTLIGAAPFISAKSTLAKVPVRGLACAGYNLNAGELLVLDGRAEIFDALLRSLAGRTGWDLLVLSNVHSGSYQMESVQALARRLGLGCEVTDDHSYAVADLRKGYEAYANLKGSNFRKQARRHAKRIAEAGRWRIDRLDGVSDPVVVRRYLHRMLTIAELGWRARERGVEEERQHQPLVRMLMDNFAPRGMVDLSILSVNDRDVAFTLALVERGTYFHVGIAHDEEIAALSPGSFLLQEAFRVLPTLGVHSVVSHGDYEYKRRWASEIVRPKKILLFARTGRGVLSRFAKFSLQGAWERLHGKAPKPESPSMGGTE